MRRGISTLLIAFTIGSGYAQTLYIPSGASGIGTSSTGNIGIRKSNPELMIDMLDWTSNEAGIRAQSVNGGTSGFLLSAYGPLYSPVSEYANKTVLQTFDNAIALAAYGSANNNQIQFYTGGRTSAHLRMVVDKYGNVGIGTTSPGTVLHLKGASGDSNTGTLLIEGSGTAALRFGVNNNYSWIQAHGSEPLSINELGNNTFINATGGNVGIGTTSPDQKLTVNGTIHSKEVKVDLSVPAPDYVFEKDYKLLSLEEIKTYIDQNKHLPEVPSAKEMEVNGVQLGEMNMILLKKMEEMTLYMIELKAQNEAMKIQMHVLSTDVSQLKN